MTAFFDALTALEKFYAACALFGALLFIVRTILMFLGHDDGVDMDHPGDVSGDADASFKALSLQGLTAFFMMFGLVALAVSKQGGAHNLWAVLAGLAAGLFTVWLIGRIFVGMKKLQADGTLRIESAVGQEGDVYLPLAPGKSGQVRVAVQGQLRVFDAVTEGSAELKTGTRIRVARVTGGNVLVVEKI
ncbi:MAG: NfeD family protein [Kiritimatiellae bacterium]|nr:NfeD family protein [Kiritimatiellia bacterium]